MQGQYILVLLSHPHRMAESNVYDSAYIHKNCSVQSPQWRLQWCAYTEARNPACSLVTGTPLDFKKWEVQSQEEIVLQKTMNTSLGCPRRIASSLSMCKGTKHPFRAFATGYSGVVRCWCSVPHLPSQPVWFYRTAVLYVAKYDVDFSWSPPSHPGGNWFIHTPIAVLGVNVMQ